MVALTVEMINGNGNMLVHMANSANMVATMTGGGVSIIGESDHTKLKNRDALDQHPIEAITNLSDRLEKIDGSVGVLTNADIDAILGF